uniref:G-type lectin S-receptor-like serine/threonine-protein kinase At1g11330 n=1 Tax=Nicotiana tabacum TaxID=4097 RepID=A0A1S4DGF5_TOBAC
MNPKIADFGLARIFKQNETEAVTRRVVGTYGYMAPEFAMEGAFSIKSDVFSFGVLMLEIAWELWKEGCALELKDPALGDVCDTKLLLRVIHVGLLCVQEGAADRPTMSDIISMLGNESMAMPPAKQPAFFTGRNEAESNSSAEQCSEVKIGEGITNAVGSVLVTASYSGFAFVKPGTQMQAMCRKCEKWHGLPWVANATTLSQMRKSLRKCENSRLL